ncbi:MAG: hypothetical protein M1835_005348 [Candelina submexicana]|nr:MAG: hypothetical protein M1835_005348 [Candelina submexicana]
MTCSGGAQYYTCSSNKFKGCCSVNPCGLTGCPDSDETFESSNSATSSTKSQSKSQGDESSTTALTSISTSPDQPSIPASTTPSPVRSVISPSTTASSIAASSQNSTGVLPGTQSTLATTQSASLKGPRSSTVGLSGTSYSTPSVTQNTSSIAPQSSTRNFSAIPSSLPVATSSNLTAATSLAIPATQTSSSISRSSTPISCSPHCSSKPKLALIGGVTAGGLTALACMIMILLWCRRRNRILKEPISEEKLAQTGHTVVSQGAVLNRNTSERWIKGPSEQPRTPIYHAFKKRPEIKAGQKVRQVPQPSSTAARPHSGLQDSIPTFLERTRARRERRPESPLSESSLNLQKWESRHANAASMGTIHLCMPCTPAQEESRLLYVVNPDNAERNSSEGNTTRTRKHETSWEDFSDRTAVRKSITAESSISGEWSDASSSMVTRRG